MQLLTLADLELGLIDLLEKRKTALRRSSSGKTYEPILAKKLDEISALLNAMVGGRAPAVELAATDTAHDGFGAAIWHISLSPSLTHHGAARRQAAER